ncbi:LOW QUALITY PROTEIN: cleavage and polyadenylation specificity factor subunit 6-like [Ananas comosus]|uniref:LOW QUALITY PROTEIN: cleavage and polyadenylation specificity factor subunit 6-like n=1 Tax=Ananas comosus TaxID=4615 RepID=A0A6P5GSC3_ANACO|nr:LOW QUALITY PROTEIN: cleavage and polyadenylation specificity factor subunit 6-like [Ananas comosus]
MDPDPPEGLDGASGGAFHPNEAISAVQDEDQFYGEDDDYDDLYNDVNVGDGFLHSVARSGGGGGAGGFPGEEPACRPHAAAAPPPPTAPEKVQVQIPGIAGVPKIERPSADRSVGFPDQGLRGGVAAEAAAAVGDGGGGGGRGGTTTLFVGELHWWTTDADLEAELSKYGPVKEVRFFDEKASGKSKGYCQVDFFDPAAATACKEGMNGHPFHGRPCVVAYASPFTVRKMGEAQVKNHHSTIGAATATQAPAQAPKGRAPPVAGNFGRGGGGNPGAAVAAAGGGGSGNWGRGGMGNRGMMGNMRNRFGPMGGRGIMGNGGMVAPPPQPPLLHPGAMMGPGFGYGGGFPAGHASAPFPGLMPSFPPVVAPHVNPAFFGRGGMAAAVAGGGGVGIGMWPDQSMGGGWGGEEQSSYGDDAASDQQYGEGNYGKDRRHEREREKDAMEDRPERKYRDDREMGRERERERERERDRERDREREREKERERDRYRDERDRHGDHYRHRERESERDDDWDRGRSSIARSKSREVEHSKRRRLSPE